MTEGVHFRDARPPAGMRLVAIGDVHGCAGLLDRLLDAIDREIAHDKPADWRILTLGDYVDRGPDARGVIDRLVERSSDTRLVALAGNHDQGILDFLADQPGQALFLGNGGRETAESYGVDLGMERIDGLEHSRAMLNQAMPDMHKRFLADLSASAAFGDFFFCHAGIRPLVPLAEQKRHDLLWIRGEFLDHPGLHPALVVHGHTPAFPPEILPNRVNIDSGAFRSGVLTALVADGDRKWLLQASEETTRRLEI